MAYFANRADAGRKLARRLRSLRATRPVVLGLARGGVPVAAEIARALDAPLDVAGVRKLGAPANRELALAAVAEGGERVINREVDLARERGELERRAASALEALQTQLRALRGDRPAIGLRERTVIVVDDGVATGASLRAALAHVRSQRPARVIAATPVIAPDTAIELRGDVDELVYLEAPEWFSAVGQAYAAFPQVSDAQVMGLLSRRRLDWAAGPSEEVQVTGAGHPPLEGELHLPAGAHGLVIFVHGSGSNRHSPRNRQVANALGEVGLATLTVDLLSREEADEETRTGALRFDVERLSARVIDAVDAAARCGRTAELALGLFGASTGAASALVAASARPERVRAVVCRGGRPDLASPAVLERVRAPVLLVVGGRDPRVQALNLEALRWFGGPAELEVVPGATHLFAEPGALEVVSHLTARFFGRHLLAPGAAAHP